MAPMPRPDDRSDARERALYLLYEAYSKGIAPPDALVVQVIEPDALTTLLVEGVGAHVAELDAAIAALDAGTDAERVADWMAEVLRGVPVKRAMARLGADPVRNGTAA